MNSFSLSDVLGDLLTAREYSAWLKQSLAATYTQKKEGSLLIEPWSQRPLRWRLVDCQVALERRNHAITQRSERLRNKFRKANAA